MKIAFFAKEINNKWDSKLSELLEYCVKRNVKLMFFNELYEHLKEKSNFSLPSAEIFSTHEELKGADLLISLGGDGTLLGSATYIRDSKIPVAGINFGRLGFLTAARFNGDDKAWIDALLDKNIALAQLPLLEISSNSLPADFYPFALNEFSIQRTAPSMISIDLKINGEDIPTYWADGLMVATSTGSTAYSLSVGGPLVMPGSNVFIIAPIAPHNLNVRPLIVPDDSVLEFRVEARDDSPIITLDNRYVKADNNTVIRLSKANYHIDNVVLSNNNSSFFKALQDKLMWGVDKRNHLL